MTSISGPSVHPTTTKSRSTKPRKSQTRQHQLRWIHLLESWHTFIAPRDQLVEEISQHAQTLCRTITDRSWLIDAFHLAIDAVLFPPLQPEDAEELERIEQLGQQLLQLAVHSVASPFLASSRPDDGRYDAVRRTKEEWERLTRRLSLYQRMRGMQRSIPVLPLTLVLRESSTSVLLCLASLPHGSEVVVALLQSFAWLVEESGEGRLSIVTQLLSCTHGYSALAASGVLIGWKDGRESSIWQSATSARPLTLEDLVGFYGDVLEEWKQGGLIEQAGAFLGVLVELMQGEDGRTAVTRLQNDFFGDAQRGQLEDAAVVKQRFDLSSVQDLAAKVSDAGTNDAAIKKLARQLLASHQDVDAVFSRVTQLVDTKDSISVRTLALEVASQASANASSRTAPILASILYARPAVGGFRLDLNTPLAFLKRAESLLKDMNSPSGSVTGNSTLGNALGHALDLDARSVVPACQLFALLSSGSADELWGDMEKHLGWLGSLASLLDGQVDKPDVDMCWLAAYGGSVPSRGGAKQKQESAFDSIVDSFNDAHPAPSSGGRLERNTDPTTAARFRAVWDKFFHECLSLTSHPGAPFSLVTSDEATRRLLSTVLRTGDVQLFRSLSSHTHLPASELERLVLDVSTSLFDSAPIATARSREIRLSQDVLLALPEESKSATLQRDFIEASCRLSSFNIKSPSGGSLTSVEIRTMKDRLKLIGIMLSTQQGAWRSSELILELARKLCGGEGRVVEGRTLAMMTEAAVAGEEDFESAARFCGRLIELVKQKGKKEEEGEKEVVREIAWKTCFGVAKHPGWEDTAARVALLGQAMVMAPAGQLGGMLRVWEGLDAMLREEIEDGKWDEGRRDGWLGGLGERAGGKGAAGMGGLSASTAASVGAGLVGTAANYLPLSLGSYFGNTGATSHVRGAPTTSTEATPSSAAGSTQGVDSRTAALFDFDSVSGAANDTAGYVDPTERAVRAARAARDFLGWKSDHQRGGEAAGAGAEGVGMGGGGGGGFSFSRGVGWLIGDGERR